VSIWRRHVPVQSIESWASYVGPALASRECVNVARFETVPLPIGLPGLAHGAVSLPRLAETNLAGFLALFNGLLDPTGTAARKVTAARPAKEAAAGSLPQVAAMPVKHRVQEKGQRRTQSGGIASNQSQTADIYEKSTTATVETKEITEIRKMTNSESGKTNDGLLMGVLPLAVGGTTTAPQLPPVEANGIVTDALPSSQVSDSSPGNAPLSSVHDLAFALRLTWQPLQKPTGAEVLSSGSDPVSPRVPRFGDTNSRNLLADDTGLSAGALSTEALTTEALTTRTLSAEALSTGVLSTGALTKGTAYSDERNPEHPIQPSGQITSEGLRQVVASPVPSTSADCVMRDRAGLRAQEILTPNGGQATERTSVTTAFSETWPKIVFSPSGSLLLPIGTDTQSAAPALTVGVEGIPELPPSSLRGSAAPEVQSRKEVSAPNTRGRDQGDQWAESDDPPRRPVAAPERASAISPGTSANDSRNVRDKDDENSGSGGRTYTAAVTHNVFQGQRSFAQPGSEPAGFRFAPSPQQIGAPPMPTKSPTPQLPQSPAPSPMTEIPNILQPHPLREISLQLGVAEAPRVDVQVVERAGKVQVAVRTADPAMADSLQNNLEQLVARLEQKGFRTEAWTPVTIQHTGPAVREPSTAAGSQNPSGGSGSRGGQPDTGQGRQESNRQQRKRWQTELEETSSGPPATT
jgi:hypothetical protein